MSDCDTKIVVAARGCFELSEFIIDYYVYMYFVYMYLYRHQRSVLTFVNN
jgi:hypothetical protein